MDSAEKMDVVENKLASLEVEGQPKKILARAMSTSAVDVGSKGPVLHIGSTGPIISLIVQEKQAPPLRSKSMAWREPMLMFEKITTGHGSNIFQGKFSRSFRHHVQGSAATKSGSEVRKLSRWARFWKRFSLDRGKKVHAARADWLNYDAQSYAMNFETDENFTRENAAKHMPKISGPEARDIVTVLLQRSSSANRNSGCILIPRPVLAMKPDNVTPLWQRRSVEAPLSLDTKTRRPTIYRRRSNVV